MPLRPKWKQAICVTSSKLFEDLFALSDIKTLKLQAIDDLITLNRSRASRCPNVMLLRALMIIFQSSIRAKIISRRPPPIAGLVPHSLLTWLAVQP
jgi:hypothetical protein